MGVTKGFKGKGDAILWESDARRHYEHIVATMQDLREESRNLFGHLYVLQLHKRFAGLRPMEKTWKQPTITLRWRALTSGNNKHMVWAEVRSAIAAYPEAMQTNYWELQRHVIFLNAQERVARIALQVAIKVKEALVTDALDYEPSVKSTE